MKYKNKTISAVSLTILGIALLAMPVLAATSFSFSPASVNTAQGQNFNLAVSFDPQGVKNYTVKLELDYPADLLEIKSFSFANSWMPITQAGYDLIDNTNGQLIKTAGYPGGISTSATFGTVSFLVKKSGNGIIKVGSNSFALDMNNQNVMSAGSIQTSVSAAAPAPVSTPPAATPKTTTPTPGAEVSEPTTPEEEISTATPETAMPEEQPNQPAETAKPTSLLAGIANIMTFGTGNALMVLVFLILLAAIVYLAYYLIKKFYPKKIK